MNRPALPPLWRDRLRRLAGRLPHPLIAVPGALAGALGTAGVASAVALRVRRPPEVARAVLVDPAGSLAVSRSGAVRSVQAAELTLPTPALDRIWTPMNLERLARTYWRFISRATLGVIRVSYTPTGREVVLLTRPFSLLSFHEPEYELSSRRGLVRWRIAKGLLVSPAGRGEGYLQIEVQRREDSEQDDCAVARVEVEVANFYPAIARGVSQWVYRETQSRMHVLVTHGFLRSLARLDLAESVIGRYARRVAESESSGPGPVPGTAWRPVQRGAARVAARRAGTGITRGQRPAPAPSGCERESAAVDRHAWPTPASPGGGAV